MKRVYLFLFLFVMQISLSVWSQSIKCIVEGTTDDKSTTEMYIVEAGADLRMMDNILSAPVVDGRFSYVLEIDTLRYCSLIPNNQYAEGSWTSANFIAEPQTVKIAFDGDNVVVNGNGKEQQMESIYNKVLEDRFLPLFASLESKRDSVENIIKAKKAEMSKEDQQQFIKEFSSKNSSDTLVSLYNNINKVYEEASFDQQTEGIEWLYSHPCFFGLAKIKSCLNFAGAEDPTIQDYIQSYKTIYNKQIPGHPYHENILDIISSKELKVGNKYIDYPISDADDNILNLSSLCKGKIILVALWASWCGPCRRKSKQIIPLYNEYKDKGFQVIAIARERKKEHMLQAIAKDGYPWQSYLDLKDQNRVWQKNGVNNAGGITFLISSDATILAVNPTAQEIATILKERLEK